MVQTRRKEGDLAPEPRITRDGGIQYRDVTMVFHALVTGEHSL